MNASGLIVDNVSWGPKVKGPLILHPLSFASRRFATLSGGERSESRGPVL